MGEIKETVDEDAEHIRLPALVAFSQKPDKEQAEDRVAEIAHKADPHIYGILMMSDVVQGPKVSTKEQVQEAEELDVVNMRPDEYRSVKDLFVVFFLFACMLTR